MTLGWLGLKDKGWFCEEPHYKGSVLHLRHKVFQAKDVIVFVRGFTGDYVNTWGKPKVLLDDPRFNRNYDFVFCGFEKALYGGAGDFDAGASQLDGMLSHLEDNYKTITIVAHGKGALLATRTLLNRAKEFPKKQPYKIHKVVMFSPPTENVSLARHTDLLKLLRGNTEELARLQADTDLELRTVKEDYKALLNPLDLPGQARMEAFTRDVTDHLYVINAEGDGVVDVGPGGEKIVAESVRKLSQSPTLGPPRLVTLRYSDIGGREEAAREKKSGVKDPAYAHVSVIKMGEQDNFSFFARFEQLLFDRIGVPPRSLLANVEQIRQSTFDRINSTIFEMNRFVVDKNPMVGLCWRNIADAVEAKARSFPEAERQAQTEELTRQIYYVYIVLDQYSQLDDLRNRGYMSANDPKLIEWKRSMLPNLIRSDVGRWMLDNNLMDYYSEPMVKDLHEAAGISASSPSVQPSAGQ
jgi:hypothetical protein